MTLRPGDVFADRFVVLGDERAVTLARKRVIDPVDPTEDAELWLRAVDQTTGARVIIERRGGPLLWACDMQEEALARLVPPVASPFLAEVLHVGPGVVYSEPPAGRPRRTFSPGEAAALSLQLCEATARLHAAGVAQLRFDPFNLRVVSEQGRHRIHWLVPGTWELEFFGRLEAHVLAPIAGLEKLRVPRRRVWWDMLNIVDFFFSLLDRDPDSRDLPAEARALWPMRKHLGRNLPPDVATLARLFLPLASIPADAAERAAALPSVTSVPPPRLDWDRVISDGHAELPPVTDERAHGHVAGPLAAAHHQRASRAWAAGDRASALRDAEQAVALHGDWLPYTTTRAVMLDALGRGEEALRSLDEAIARASEKATSARAPRLWPVPARERARAYATRGMIAFRRGELAEAARDLRRAMDAHPTAHYARCLGAALHALGDLEGAAEAEEKLAVLRRQQEYDK